MIEMKLEKKVEFSFNCVNKNKRQKKISKEKEKIEKKRKNEMDDK